MDLQTTKLLAGAALGALTAYLFDRPLLLGAAIGVGSTLLVEQVCLRHPDAGSGRQPGAQPIAATAGPTGLRLVPLIGRQQVSVASTESEVGWVGQEALDPIHRALWAVDHEED